MSFDLVLAPLATGQTIVFWICAVLAILGAVGVIASPKPVYSALCLALVMVALAAIYASLQAEFLFAVQIIVYTGAVLMLFLFVIMLVGVSSQDSLTEILKGHRGAALVAGLALIVLLALATGNALTTPAAGLDDVAGDSYIQSLAQLIFQRYVIAFEATSALLITAAVAAMVLAHPQRLRPKPDQASRLRQRMRAYAEDGVSPAPLPNSGVTARHNSIATPALLPDGTIAPGSVSATITARVDLATAHQLTGPMRSAVAALEGGSPLVPSDAELARSVAAAAIEPAPATDEAGATDAGRNAGPSAVEDRSAPDETVSPDDGLDSAGPGDGEPTPPTGADTGATR